MSDGLKLLSAAIANDSPATIMRLDPELFIDRERIAFDFVKSHYRAYRALPTAQTVQSELDLRLPAANEPLQFYVDSVTDRHSYNLMAQHYATMREQLRTANMAEVAETVRQMNVAMQGRQRAGTVVSMGEALGQVLNRLEATRGYGGITGIPSGWEGYDEITGGYQNSDLITIVGRPSLGKTYQLLKQADYAHEVGHSPLFITTEMGIEQIGRRYASLKLGINPTMLKMNMISTHLERRIRALQVEMMRDTRLKIFSVGMGTKVSAIEALIQEFGPDAVYLDGAYLLHPTAKGKMNRIERVGEVFDELKGLTISAGIPIINTMQFNRQAGKDGKEGSLETIGFTDAVGMHSSIVIRLGFGPTENPRESRENEFLKGREGETGKIYTNFKFAPVDFSELHHVEGEGEAANDDGGDESIWRA